MNWALHNFPNNSRISSRFFAKSLAEKIASLHRYFAIPRPRQCGQLGAGTVETAQVVDSANKQKQLNP
jgi:hypothetical protein